MKNILIIFASILALSTNACASSGLPTSYEVMISSDFTPDEIHALEGGISSWEQLGLYAPSFYFEIVSPFSLPQESEVGWSTIVIHKASVPWIRANGGVGDAIAITHTSAELCNEEDDSFNLNHSEIGASIYAPGFDSLSQFKTYGYTEAAMLFGIGAHESGHAMGLRHELNPGQLIMNPRLNEFPTDNKPTCGDLQQYCNIRHDYQCTCNPIQ
jgi:hypothetical protein